MQRFDSARPSRGKTIFAATGVALALAGEAFAQGSAAPTVLTTHPLKGGVYWVEGGSANTGFVVGDKGVVVIDTQISTEDGQKAIAQITKVTKKPINEIVLTHADPDHIGGLPAYPAGTEIIAHENTKAEIRASAADPNGGPVFRPLYRAIAAGFLPTRTLSGTESMTLDGVQFVLIHVSPAHTSGDLIVYLPAKKIVFAGDILLTNTGRFPVLHVGGSSQGWIQSMKAMLALDADTYVSGHGTVQTKSQLRARLHDAEQRRAQIKAMVNDNKSRADVDRALPEQGASPMFLDYTQSVYEELTKGYPAATAPWANLIHQ
jgi:glyoxylase-like metal-dependent hydrolase (beta-lactamase superfamily II)